MRRHEWEAVKDGVIWAGAGVDLWEFECLRCGVLAAVDLVCEDEPSRETLAHVGAPEDCDEGFVWVLMNS